MFLRASTRKKNGKEHRYWSIVENRRLPGGRVLQRHVLYLGEINSSQELAWRKSIEVLDEEAGEARTLALFATAEPKLHVFGRFENASFSYIFLSFVFF